MTPDDPVSAERTSVTPVRRHDLDRLRILAVLLLFVFHTARIFDVDEAFYAKNSQTSQWLTWGVVQFLNPWHMPLLFVLAGAATWFALGFRTPSTYARERTRRLLVPFLFGVIVIVPPQAYLAQRLLPNGETSYVAFLGDYWQMKGDLSGYTGQFTPGHLWFILYLFLFSLIALPLFVRIRRVAGGPSGRDIGRPWMLAAVPAVMLLVEALPSPEGAWSPFTTLVLFIAGFILLSSESLQTTVRRWWPWFLAAGVVTMALELGIDASNVNDGWGDFSWPQAGFGLVEASNTWLWVLGLIGGAGAYLNGPGTPTLRYANEAAYPCYILHQTVIAAVGYVVVQWDLGVWSKYIVILIASFTLTVGLYDVAVRRTNPTRFLFGLKPKKRMTTRRTAAARPAATTPR